MMLHFCIDKRDDCSNKLNAIDLNTPSQCNLTEFNNAQSAQGQDSKRY